MGIKIIRIIFILACAIMGGIWASHVVREVINPVRDQAGQELFSPGRWEFVGGLLGFAVAVTVLFCLRLITQEIFEKLSPALVAIVLALIMGYGTAQYILSLWDPGDEMVPRRVTLQRFRDGRGTAHQVPRVGDQRAVMLLIQDNPAGHSVAFPQVDPSSSWT